ncbi:hypothetical protein AB0O34_33090 [Sphaerisporangium sp. NPDC088356]|uniref:hypothetical protein n=1 Tax=Sphaerisporangium sp. NPDC088356 TaxID=3154871 RepID=UPI0034489449
MTLSTSCLGTSRDCRRPAPAVEEEWSDVLNNEAKCGWRLVSVAFLERGVTDAYSEFPSRRSA